MNVLVACEMSGVVREAFRSRGHQAFSCDLVPSLDGSRHHFQADVFDVIDGEGPWDLMIAHPPCDRLLNAGALHWKKWQSKVTEFAQQRAIVFFMRLALARIAKIAIENPRGIISSVWRKPDQVINPYEFGHTEQKQTCIWLESLPKLIPTKNVYDEMMKLPKHQRERIHYESPGVRNGLTRSQRRSITYQGIANAMAEQWGNILLNSK